MIPRHAIAALVLLCLGPNLFAEAKPKPASRQVPYRLADTKHLIVRVKINGKGPYNFIIDTGAPALYVNKSLGQKLELTSDKEGWSGFDRFELEGGLVLDKPRGRVEDIPQLAGINGLGAAGVELHGLIGYNILAQYRIEYDLTRDKMTWTRLDYEVKLPEKLGKGTPAGVDAMGGIMKMVGAFMGRKTEADVAPRGFLGIELADARDAVSVKAVLAKSPAAEAGLKAGDTITHFQDKPKTEKITLKLGKGL
jgi:PDZ domain-containing protein/aspartyl protease